ncbi:MAG: hypothetical protein HY077_18510 [Elusimicrobia bacterium]|nr:hypothetical protein [Elusimicrobiota bacterium]
MTLPAILCATGMLLLGWQTFHFYPLFPAHIASHFALSGKPNAEMPKAVFFGFMWGIYLIVFLYSLFATKVFPERDAKRLPDSDYWLAPERREQTVGAVQTHLAWEGAFTMVFLYLMLEFVADANLRTGRLDVRSFTAILVGFIVLVLGSRWNFKRGFKRP